VKSIRNQLTELWLKVKNCLGQAETMSKISLPDYGRFIEPVDGCGIRGVVGNLLQSWRQLKDIYKCIYLRVYVCLVVGLCAHLLCSSACQHCHRCRHCHLKFITVSVLDGWACPMDFTSYCTLLLFMASNLLSVLALSLFWPYAINSFVAKWNCTFACSGNLGQIRL